MQQSIVIMLYFATGYEIEEHDNPADFFLDIVNFDLSAIRTQTGNSNKSNKNELHNVIIFAI